MQLKYVKILVKFNISCLETRHDDL